MWLNRFFAEVEKLLQEYPLDAWKSYLTWNLLRTSAPFLSSAFENAAKRG